MPKYDFDSAPIIQPKKQSYDFDSAPIVKSEANVPEWKSALRGAAQGVTSGFADELTAGAEALLTPKSYDQALAESRANYKQAEQANPITYNVGDIAGSIAQPTPFGKLSLATKGGKLALKAAQAGAMGGLETLGKSDDKSASDFIGGGAASAGLTAGLGGLGKLAGKASKLLPDKASVIGTMTMRDPKVLREYQGLKNKSLYNELNKTGEANDILPQISESLESTFKKTPFRNKAVELSDQAYNVLEKNKVEVNPTSALELINAKLEKANNTPIKDTGLINFLESTKASIFNDAQNFGGTIPGARIKGALQVMDAAGKGQQDYSEPIQRAAKELRSRLDNELKKDKEYADIMRKTAAATKADKRIQDLFLTKGNIDPDKIKRQISDSKNIKSNRELAALSSAMQQEGVKVPYGASTLNELVDTMRVKKSLDNPSFQGSNLMNMFQGLGGGTVGGLAGSGIGSYSSDSPGTGMALGSVAGAIMQKKSGAIARKAIDFKNPINNLMNKIQGTKYAPYFNKIAQGAADVAPRKMAVNMYLLLQKDPEFREMTKGDD